MEYVASRQVPLIRYHHYNSFSLSWSCILHPALCCAAESYPTLSQIILLLHRQQLLPHTSRIINGLTRSRDCLYESAWAGLVVWEEPTFLFLPLTLSSFLHARHNRPQKTEKQTKRRKLFAQVESIEAHIAETRICGPHWKFHLALVCLSKH